MINKSLDEIEKEDIEELIKNEVREKLTIEYKRELPDNSNKGKLEFLKQICSFANAAGGDLLYGIKAFDGVPEEAIGVNCNIDEKILQLESMIRDSIAPRIPGVRIKPIEGFPQGPVLLIRIPKSWAAPHMVTFNKMSHFYTRNSAGKHQMDVTEIRSAFLASETLAERMKRFRDERLSRIIALETPVPMKEGPKVVIHLLPLISFEGKLNLDVIDIERNKQHLTPRRELGGNFRYNIDGLLTYLAFSSKAAYIQAFRQGQIEAVDTDILADSSSGPPSIASVLCEIRIMEKVYHCFKLFKALEIPPPVFIFITFLDVKGVILHIGHEIKRDPIDRDTLLLPDIMVENYNELSSPEGVAKALRPAFDALWNACGYERCYHYDEKGDYIHLSK